VWLRHGWQTNGITSCISDGLISYSSDELPFSKQNVQIYPLKLSVYIYFVRKVAVHLGYGTYIWLHLVSVPKLPLQCAVISLYSVVKQRLKCNTGKVCNCVIQVLRYRRLGSSLPKPFICAQRLSESTVQQKLRVFYIIRIFILRNINYFCARQGPTNIRTPFFTIKYKIILVIHNDIIVLLICPSALLVVCKTLLLCKGKAKAIPL
jgi:hypothetical protein